MAGKNWQEVKETFHQALRLEPGERDRFLERTCDGDIDFRIEVESLLISFADAKQFLERPIVGEFERKNNWRLADGHVISHYRILSPIASGGMGEVYLAEDTQLARRVAIKLLPSHLSDDRDRLRRFEHEARVVSALNHPNILTIFEFGNDEGMHFLAAEFVSGETLRERLSRGRLNTSDAVEIATQIVSALKAAHEAGVVHRDIKPENIMIRDDGIVKVLDFGLAKLTEKSRQNDAGDAQIQFFSNPGLILGTAAYMSPEQARAVSIDHRSDIFSLGIVLYEMIAGKAPFSGETTTDVIAAMIQSDPPHIKDVVPAVPDELDAIIAKALEKDRNDRFGSAAEMLAELKRISPSGESPQAVSLEHQATLPLRPPLDTSSSRSYRRQFIAAGAFVAVALAAAAIWKLTPDRKDENLLASLRIRQLMNWDGEAGEGNAQAKFSPNGMMIAFSLVKNGRRDIWTKQIPDGKPNPITDGKWDYYNPIWSPDGQRIAFTANINDQFGVWEMPFSGGKLALIKVLDREDVTLLKWAENGATIYYQKGVYQEGSNLFSLDVATGVAAKLTSFDATTRAQSFNISPDGNRVAFLAGPNEGLDIFVMPIRGGQPVQVTNDEAGDEYPFWLPDGNRIIYSSKRDGIFQTCIVYVNELRTEQLNLGIDDTLISDVSSDGTKVLFEQSRVSGDLWRTEIEEKTETQITSESGLELWADVSPNGESIVFQATTALKHVLNGPILIRSNENGQQISLTSNGFSPAFSPDGRRIAFFRYAGDVISLWVVGRNGSGERQVTNEEVWFAGFNTSPFNRVRVKDYSWSLDSSRLIYSARKEGLWNIWQAEAEDAGPPSQLSNNVDNSAVLSNPLSAPNGLSVAYISSPSAIATGAGKSTKLNLISGSSTEVLFSSENLEIEILGWTTDNEVVAALYEYTVDKSLGKVRFARISKRGRTEIATVDAVYFNNMRLSPDGQRIAYVKRGGESDRICLLPISGSAKVELPVGHRSKEYVSSIVWAPDGKSVYYSLQKHESLILMIENFK